MAALVELDTVQFLMVCLLQFSQLDIVHVHDIEIKKGLFKFETCVNRIFSVTLLHDELR